MRFLKLSALMALAGLALWAQGTAQINGTVSDSSGSAVPGADVKVTQTATGQVRNTTSSTDGGYVLPNLPTGPYMIEVSKEGFTKYVQSGIVLQVQTNPTVDVALKIGSVTEQVLVTADAAMVETQSTAVGQVVDNKRVLEMPLNGRNATELVFLAGMATIGGNNGGFLNSVRNYPTVMISVAGGIANQQNYTLDGANHNDAYNGLNLPLPFPDALQEFKVETSALPAAYGIKSSAAISAITKSGTNEIHGDLFEFLRNGQLNARNFFAPVRDTLKRNQFGGVVGGPVKKDKLFFFYGFQGTVQRSEPAQNIAYVPTPAMLAGDFTTIAGPGCNAGRTIALPTQFGFNGNRIAPTGLNPAALKISARLPTSTDPCGKVNYGLKSNQEEYMHVAKVDFTKSDKHSMFVRMYATHLTIPSTFDGKNALTLNSNLQDDRVYALAFGDTYSFSPTIIGNFRFGLHRTEIPKIVDNFATWPELGVNAPYNPAPAPRVSVTGNAFTIGSGNSIINHDYTGPNPNFTGDMNVIRGSHQIGFGVNWLRNSINYQSGINATGLPTFNGVVTGLSLADFMIGETATWTQGNISYFYNRQNYVGLYAQDTWKATRRLTINYGVRWEPFFPIRSKQGLFMRFDQNNFNANIQSQRYVNAPAGLVFPGDPDWSSGNSIANKRYNIWVPRLGFVWDPKGDGRMTIRAAIGSFTDRSGLYALSSFGQDPPIGNVVTVQRANLSNPWATYPGGNPLPIALQRNMTFPTNGAYITYPSDWKPLWLNQWNLSIQRQFGNNLLMTANYLGNNTFHLVGENQLNPAIYVPGNCVAGQYGLTAAGPCSSLANVPSRRPLTIQNPAQGRFYGIIAEGAPHGTGSYNALYLQLQKRMSNGLSVLANYTWAHCISDQWNGQPGNNGVATGTPNNRRADRGNCAPNLVSSDIRHQFNLSIVAETPHFQSKALDWILGNWQFAPIIKARSGSYFTVTSGVDIALNGQGNQRPNLADPSKIYATNKGVDGWLDSTPLAGSPAGSKGGFAVPTAGQVGNLGIGNVLGPAMFQVDLAVSRTFKVYEKQTLQLRGEAFNLPNHFNPANPISALNSATYGKIQSDVSGTSGLNPGNQRIIQLALKYVF